MPSIRYVSRTKEFFRNHNDLLPRVLIKSNDEFFTGQKDIRTCKFIFCDVVYLSHQNGFKELSQLEESKNIILTNFSKEKSKNVDVFSNESNENFPIIIRQIVRNLIKFLVVLYLIMFLYRNLFG